MLLGADWDGALLCLLLKVPSVLGETQPCPQHCTCRYYSPAVTPGSTSDAVAWPSSITTAGGTEPVLAFGRFSFASAWPRNDISEKNQSLWVFFWGWSGCGACCDDGSGSPMHVAGCVDMLWCAGPPAAPRAGGCHGGITHGLASFSCGREGEGRGAAAHFSSPVCTGRGSEMPWSISHGGGNGSECPSKGPRDAQSASWPDNC